MSRSGAEALLSSDGSDDVDWQVQEPARLLHRVEVRTWPGVVAEHERALRVRRERRTRKEPARVHRVVDDAYLVLGNCVFLGQALETVVVNGHIAQDSPEAWRGGHVRPPVVTHEQAARMPKLEEGFDGLDVVVPVNDVWFFRHVLQVREHGNTRRANLVGNLSKLRRVHHWLMPGRSQAEREVPQRGLCACTTRERHVHDQDSQAPPNVTIRAPGERSRRWPCRAFPTPCRA